MGDLLLLVWISLVLAVGAVVIPCLALWQRIKANKGIGWQFIRFTVIVSTLPIVAILALNSLLTGEAAALLGSALGYAFGHSTDMPSKEDQGKDA